MIKTVANLPVEKLLSKDDNNKEVFYKIPPYQREYAWSKAQWENLFDDLHENDQGYFLGSIICINNNINDILDVVDGQQRLTSLSILLNALFNVINNYDTAHPDEDIINPRKNKENGQAYYLLQDVLYINNNTKLTLSMQSQNNEDYRSVLSENGLLQATKPSYFGTRRVSKAYEYFKSRLNEIDDDGNIAFTIDGIFEYLKKVLSALLVKIEVDDVASAFILFESINNRGIPLTPIDLIKNSIIGKMEKDYNINPEKTNVEWQTVIRNIESYNDQVRFLRHYYHAFQCCNKKNVKLKSFTKATKSNIMKIYSSHITKDVDFIFNELIAKSKIYTIFVDPEKIENDDKFYLYKNKLIDLQRLGVAPSYSLLLYLFSEKDGYDFSNILDFIENWFIRRHLTDYPATNKLDQIFLDLISILCEDNDIEIFEQIKIFLTNSKRYKNDNDFKEILTNGDLYDINSGATRCILTKLEKSKRTKENKVNFWEMTGIKKPTLVWSIEHIYPQKPAPDSDWNNFFTEDDKKEYLHRLGNLTLTCYNSTLSNKSYKNKISIKDKEDKDIGLKSGNVEINEYLINKADDEWTKDDIELRGNDLSNNIIALLTVDNE